MHLTYFWIYAIQKCQITNFVYYGENLIALPELDLCHDKLSTFSYLVYFLEFIQRKAQFHMHLVTYEINLHKVDIWVFPELPPNEFVKLVKLTKNFNHWPKLWWEMNPGSKIISLTLLYHLKQSPVTCITNAWLVLLNWANWVKFDKRRLNYGKARLSWRTI